MSHAQQPHAQHGGHATPHHAPEPLPLRPSHTSTHSPAHSPPHSGPGGSMAGHSHYGPHTAGQGAKGAHVAQPRGHFHPLPVIGHAEAFYLKHIEQAEAAGDRHARAAHKVGQHTTSALDPKMPWEQKLKRFVHCLERYCVAPADADEALAAFYHKLGDLVRRHAGQEALHMARKHHDEYQRRQRGGESREAIEEQAEVFFFDLLGHGGRPDWCSKEAWTQITTWRDHWV